MLNKTEEEALQNIVKSEVYYNNTMLINDLIKENFKDFSYDNVDNLKENDEIFEWYACSDWLIDKLDQQNEPILRTDYDDYWGRTTTGQGIYLDNVLLKIYDSIK